VPRVDVHDGEREARRAEGLLGEAQQHDRVLAAREEQHRALELGRDLAHDEDGLGFERVEMGQAPRQGALGDLCGFDHRRLATMHMGKVELRGLSLV